MGKTSADWLCARLRAHEADVYYVILWGKGETLPHRKHPQRRGHAAKSGDDELFRTFFRSFFHAIRYLLRADCTFFIHKPFVKRWLYMFIVAISDPFFAHFCPVCRLILPFSNRINNSQVEDKKEERPARGALLPHL